MGIPAFFSLVVRKYKNIVRPLNSLQGTNHNLYLDCNSIVYDCVKELEFTGNAKAYEKAISLNVCRKVVEYISHVKPTETVCIAFDGVAPCAKLEQQRSRRYRSWFTSQFIGDTKDKWNTMAITPGTSFMNTLGATVSTHFKNPKKFGVNEILVSDSNEAGEGEHKIFSYIRNNPDKHANQRTIVYGLDADLIMLTLNHIPYCGSIYLYRETPHFIRSLNRQLEPNTLYVLDIPNLSNGLASELIPNSKYDGSNVLNTYNISNITRIVNDYVFMCFLLGNDFIPHMPSLNLRTTGMQRLIKCYRKIQTNGEFLVSENKIKWNSMRRLIALLANKERKYFINEMELRDTLEKKNISPREGDNVKEHELNCIPVYNRAKERYIEPREDYWEWRYYKVLFDIDISTASGKSELKRVCLNYLEALEWTHKYYTNACPDWRWTYDYHYAPLMMDVLKYMPALDTDLLEQQSDDNSTNIKGKHTPLKPMVQLSYVLPKAGLSLLPKTLERRILEAMDECYSENWEFEWSFCRYFWEAHPKMAQLSIDKLERVINRYMRRQTHEETNKQNQKVSK